MGIFLKAAALSAGAAEMERLLGFDAQLLFDNFLTGISIFVLFTGLSYLLFNPAKAFLEKRREKIRTDLDTAKQKKKDAIALKEDYESRIKEINKEAEEIMTEARKKAKVREGEIIEEAREEAARIKERAKQEVALERKKALDEMKQEMITIASAMAGKVVAASIDTTIQDGLVEETLKEMGDHTWLS